LATKRASPRRPRLLSVGDSNASSITTSNKSAAGTSSNELAAGTSNNELAAGTSNNELAAGNEHATGKRLETIAAGALA
jgi:hypothetical protein